jgi:hypothetical protein
VDSIFPSLYIIHGLFLYVSLERYATLVLENLGNSTCGNTTKANAYSVYGSDSTVLPIFIGMATIAFSCT